jgi:hypothetical protein
VKLFPDAEFTACDLDESGVKFCAETFGAQPIVSQPEFCDVDLNGLYDLIWVGSLFTHTPKDVTQRWMAHLSHFLNPTGIVVATFHGRWSETVHKHAPYIKAQSWDKIVSGYRQDGYGYCDYVEKESHEFIESGYGISLSQASTVIDMVMQIPGVRLFMYSERAWADHQDVVVYGKPPHDKPWPDLSSLRR